MLCKNVNEVHSKLCELLPVVVKCTHVVTLADSYWVRRITKEPWLIGGTQMPPSLSTESQKSGCRLFWQEVVKV